MVKFILAGCLVLSPGAAFAARAVGVISAVADTVHIEFSGQQSWDYDVKRLERKGQTIIEMTAPPFDEATTQAFDKFRSDLVTSVKVDTKGPDGKFLIQFTLVNDKVELFDYLTDQPSRLILDFYKNPNEVAKKEPASPSKIPKAIEKTESDSKVVQQKTPNKVEKLRSPATADVLNIVPEGNLLTSSEPQVKSGIFDGGDPNFERFSVKDYEIKEEALIKANDNYYIPFPMVETPVSYWEKMKITPTIYQIARGPSDENKQARLLLTLFEKQRFAVFLKTYDWFHEKYPESTYNSIFDFMLADVRMALFNTNGLSRDFDEAIQKYKEAVEKYPDSPIAERTSLKIGFTIQEKGDHLAAIRLFRTHVENKNFGDKNALSKDLARLGIGISYAKLNRWDEAIGAFEDLEKNSVHADIRVDAGYRRGDVWIRAKKYTKAIEEYQRALKKFPEGQPFFPNAFYNQAEALFWEKKFGPSLDAYREFVKRFPKNDHAAFAITRLAEIMEIFGVDKSRVIGAHLETYFRYGESPSAIISRLRLLSTRMKGMKPKEVVEAVNEIMSLAQKVDLPDIEQFATIMVADGYNRREEYQKSIDLLSKYYKQHPSSVDVPLVTNRIILNINDKIRLALNKGRFIEALQTHSKFSDNWLKHSDRLDTKYSIGRAFEMGGAHREAQEYFKDVLNKLYSLKGTPKEKEIQVKEVLPSEDELHLRLASVALAQQKFSQSYDFIKNMKHPERLSDAEQIERVGIATQLLERRGDTDSAVRYLGELLNTWKGRPELVAEPYLKLAELQKKQGLQKEALKSLERIDALDIDSGKVSAIAHSKALEMMGQIQLDSGNKELAIQSFEKLLERYEDVRPLSSIRYKLGELYFNSGAIQKAADVWGNFKGEKSAFWKNLGQEQLKNSEWRDGYKKYIKRIPAMSASEQGK